MGSRLLRLGTPALLALLLSACGFLHDEQLVGPYRLVAVDTSEQMALAEGTKSAVHWVIPATVFAVGWNASFIIAKQHPFDVPRAATPDKTVTNFWIIRISDKTVMGPLTKEEFETRRTAIGVPTALQFTKEFPELAGAEGAPNSALLADAYPAALRASASAAKRER